MPNEYESSLANVIFPHVTQKQLAFADLRDSIKNWRIWLLLAYQDIKLRYRRSILGPFWITLSMAITVYSMGYLYSYLFRMPIREYFPYLVAGMLAWSLISTTITDLVDTFTNAGNMLKQIKLPYSLYIHRIIARNMLIFFHNIFVIVPVLIIFSVKLNLNFLLLIPGLFIIYFNAMTFGIILAMIGARYRDISQIIKSLIVVVFFITPIMWKPSILSPNKQLIISLNPFYALVELIRAPLNGYLPSTMNIMMVSMLTLTGLIVSYVVFTSRRTRIIYWL